VGFPVTKKQATGYVEAVKNPDQGGFTHPHIVSGEDPTDKNIMVSLKGAEQQTPSNEITPRHVVRYARTHRNELVPAGRHLGGYLMGPMEGQQMRNVALDVSIGVPFKGRNAEKLPLTEAMRIAAVNDQESVYDPRPRAANMFPSNPHFKGEVPADAGNKDAWASRWLSERLTR
jgi:hypothetical protein